MKELDTLIEKQYKQRRPSSQPHLGVEELIKLVESVYTTLPAILSEEAAPQATKTDSRSYTLSLIPMPQFSEIAWGTLTTPEKGGEPMVGASDFRKELSQYMGNIGGGKDLRGKIEELNAFYRGELAPTNFTSQSDKISKYLSYLVFYKTLTSIFTGFNASSAGFLFEPFLAILLDAQTGEQIPASGASTIADFRIYDGSRPISLKAYTHDQLKVGGSFRMLIDDLVGKYPVMEYICVTKEMEKGSNNPLSVQGKLHFMAFNFTLENVADIIYYVSGGKHRSILQLPKAFWDADIAEKATSEDFASFLKMPSKSEINVPFLIEEFDKMLKSSLASAGLSSADSEKVLNHFYNYAVDRTTGTYHANGKLFVKGQTKAAPPMTGSGRYPGVYKTLYDAIANQQDMDDTVTLEVVVAALDKALSRYRKFIDGGSSKKKEKASPQSLKVKELNYQSPEKSYQRLVELRQTSIDAYKVALQSLRGVIHNDQFELSEKSLLKNLPTIPTQDNLFPYGRYQVGDIEIGRENIQQVLNRCIVELNNSILDIFASLKGLTDNLNEYVAGGLEDDALVTNPETGARAEAQNIDKKTTDLVSE